MLYSDLIKSAPCLRKKQNIKYVQSLKMDLFLVVLGGFCRDKYHCITYTNKDGWISASF